MLTSYMQNMSRLFTLALLLIFSVAPNAQAQNEASNHARVEILKSAPYYEAGETYRIGIAFDMDPQWHIYWRYGGETGLPPEFRFSRPDGIKAPEIKWPTAEYINYEGMINYGYHDETVLFADLSVPADFNAGIIDLDLDIEWLICKDICVPEFGSYNVQILSKDAAAKASSAATFTQDPRIAAYESRLPQTFDGEISFTASDFNFDITITPENAALFSALKTAHDKGERLYFAPHEWGLLKPSSDALILINDEETSITLSYPRGGKPYDTLESAQGSLVVENADGHYSYKLSSEIEKTAPPVLKTETETETETKAQSVESIASEDSVMQIIEEIPAPIAFTFGKALFFSFIGGLILNLMPCVFPILSLKALSLIKSADKTHKSAVLSGVSYSAGVILSFVAIAGVMILLQRSGAEIGWGFQLQDKSVLYVLTLLMFAIGLSLSGALKLEKIIPSSISGVGQKHAEKSGLSGSFFTGLLATIVAAPCTAPFMAAALGFAATQPPLHSLSVFAMLGAGLAFPYMLLSAVPPARKMLPRPGAWMEGFRQFLAFPMYATAIWLGLILVQQDEYMFLTPLLVALLIFSFFIWLFDRQPKHTISTVLRGLLLIFCAALLVYIPLRYQPSPMPAAISMDTHAAIDAPNAHFTFSQDSLAEALDADKTQPVFVYLTADWCITCKVNERRVLARDKTEALFAANRVKIFKGDWTKRNADITHYLSSFNRNGVPLYIYYGPADAQTATRPEPVLLPQLLSFGDLEELFN
jgi:thiol:disulfide interchange protein